jgi:hypothetical protein
VFNREGELSAAIEFRQLRPEIVPANRLMTIAEFHRLADVPLEVEWFANLSNPSTRRTYENAVRDFVLYTGIARPEEFRTVARAHIIAWREDLMRRGLGGSTIRHRLASLTSLFEYLCEKNAVTHNPVKGVERRGQDAGDRGSSGTGAARRATARYDQVQARPRDPVHASVPRPAPRGIMQAEGQGLPPRAEGRAASEGLRQRRQDAVFERARDRGPHYPFQQRRGLARAQARQDGSARHRHADAGVPGMVTRRARPLRNDRDPDD